MPSKDFMNRRKRQKRRLDGGKLGSVATKSCKVDGVSDDGNVLNVNSPGVSLGDGILESVSMVDGAELHSKNVLVESESNERKSVDGVFDRGSLVDGSLVGSSFGENFVGESSLVDCSLDNSSLNLNDLNLTGDFDNVSLSSEVSYERTKRGRPKKLKRSTGRPKKSNVIENSCVMEVSNNVQNFMPVQATDIPMGPVSHLAGPVLHPDNNTTSNIVHAPVFLSIDLLDIPFGPMPDIENRIFTDDIVFSRPEIISLWSDPTVWLQDSFVFIYLKFLSYRSHLNVVVVSPHFIVVEHHFGQGVEPLNIFEYCYNYNQDYDILLIPIIFPGHFGLVIFDRSDRNNFSCIFVDSLPSVNRLTDVTCGVFDQRRVDLIKSCICDLTPGLFAENINIQVLSRSQFTEQRDGISCGFFVCLYSELFLFNNKSLMIPNLNIQHERKRILWHLSQLILSNDIDYVGIFDYNPRNAPVNDNIIALLMIVLY
ncbi:unnamed protein product [Meloidogyne enterolobii]|uniref:Uncharacterized protein n=1 Tax=Meloidogyne enterolobii TaxID=390850 RepID=A0ACB1AWT6_MELEN